jgi:hypothetical protein
MNHMESKTDNDIHNLFSQLETKKTQYDKIQTQLSGAISFIELLVQNPIEGNAMLQLTPNINNISLLSDKIQDCLNKIDSASLEDLAEDYVNLYLSWDKLKENMGNNKMKIKKIENVD